MLMRINPEGVHTPSPTYCHVVDDTSRGILHVAGQVGLSPDGKLVGADMASQLRQILANFDAILRASTLVQVARLFRPEVKIEIDAILHRE
jgi:enamine deaminase RidA (YjgF/YER057c/UK114 family)